MLPRETSIRQLKMLRKETKGKDIGDLTTNDRMNSGIPNLQYIGNPVDHNIESWEEFAEKDSKLQTIAFKSKLVNKSIKESKYSDMKNIENVLKFKDFDDNWKEENVSKTKRTDVAKDVIKEYYSRDSVEAKPAYDEYSKYIETLKKEILNSNSDIDEDALNSISDKEVEDLYNYLKNDEIKDEENIQRFENFKVEETKKSDTEEKPFHITEGPEKGNNKIVTSKRPNAKPAPQKPKSKIDEIKESNEMPKYTMLGQEEESKSDPNFGIGAVKAQWVKKISDFNVIDPQTPKERSILNAGVYIDNDIMNGRVNRIDGKDVYIESPDDPLVIKKFSLKDAVKLKKEK